MQSWNYSDEEIQNYGQFDTGSSSNVDQNNFLVPTSWDPTSQPPDHSDFFLNRLNSASDQGFHSSIETRIDYGYGVDNYPNDFPATTEVDSHPPLNH